MDDCQPHARPAKVCPRCNVLKPLEHFYIKRGSRDGHQGYCKPCSCSVVMASKIAQRDYWREQRRIARACFMQMARMLGA